VKEVRNLFFLQAVKDRVPKTKKHSLSAVYKCGIIYICCKFFPCGIPYHIVRHDSLVTDKNMLPQMNKHAVLRPCTSVLIETLTLTMGTVQDYDTLLLNLTGGNLT